LEQAPTSGKKGVERDEDYGFVKLFSGVKVWY